ncbi:hypothetical protein [Psychrobacter sp. DAB_AL32B]|uniref:hypothetical protein n=1 Tax=Psychrobacter sp. DAB_AL32B TaxID=1028414 RepID=UPI000B7F8F19|nr:hypothetical protein [Psychrobacter sp. DAB_AL32B]OXL28864.1 hypothetical protein CAN34_00205 [Psychrobacter sp. DAB_AL32B]
MNMINKNLKTATIIQLSPDNKQSNTTRKKWLFVILATSALTLSACDKKDESTMEGSALEVDSQTSEQEAAAEIAMASEPMHSNREESAILPSNDMPENTGAVSEDGAIVSEDMSNDEVGINRSNDSEVLNSGETEEPVSTY